MKLNFIFAIRLFNSNKITCFFNNMSVKNKNGVVANCKKIATTPFYYIDLDNRPIMRLFIFQNIGR